MARKKIFALDLSALAYPMMRTRRTESNFHFSALLKENVDPSLLTDSLADVLSRYPLFKTRVTPSFFWHVLKEHDAPLVVKENDRVPLLPLRKQDTNGYPFRLAYKGKEIVLEVFHAVTDANVAALFLSDLLTRYADRKEGREGELPNRNLVVEDAFLRFGEKKKLKDISLKSYNGESVYALGEKGVYRDFPELLSLELPLDEVKAAAREAGATLTEYVAAAYIAAILQEEPLPLKKPLCLFVPVDLRRFFPSATMQNFVCFERIFLPKGETDISLPHLISVVRKEFAQKITAENMQSHVNDVRRALTLPLVKYTPLFIKEPIFKFVKCVMNKVRQTAILSNVGTIELPPCAQSQVEKVKFFLNIGKNAPINLALSSYNGVLNVNVTNGLKGRELPERLFSLLLAQGKK